MAEYPPYWLCSICNKPFIEHVQIGEPDQEFKFDSSADRMGIGVATQNWCLKIDDKNNKSGIFNPIDNLTLIERIVNARLSK